MLKTSPTQGATRKQIVANRLNALRHRLTSQVSLMTPEDRTAFEHHLNDYLKIHEPANTEERDRAVERNIYPVGPTRNAQLAAFSSAQTFLGDIAGISYTATKPWNPAEDTSPVVNSFTFTTAEAELLGERRYNDKANGSKLKEPGDPRAAAPPRSRVVASRSKWVCFFE